MTLILNICVCGSSYILISGKSTILAFFGIGKGVWPYRHAHDIPLVTLIQKMCFCGLTQPFKHESWIHRKTNTQTDYSHLIV